jgi:hypothetical protein
MSNRAKTTVKLADIKANANAFFHNTADDQKDGRLTLHLFVAHLLMGANAYNGFRYLTTADLDGEKTPGIVANRYGEGKHDFPDESRIAFY